MEYWKIPPVVKVYEALGAVADGRVEMIDDTHSKVVSSDGLKKYDVVWDRDANAIMANDNGSYWVGYLGYPSIAVLMENGVLPYDEVVGEMLKGITWKVINTRHKNDFEKTMGEIFLGMPGENRVRIGVFGEKVLKEIEKLGMGKLGKKTRPPRENIIEGKL